MKRGAVLVDAADPSETPRLLFFLEHAVHDGRRSRDGAFLTISKRLQFIEVGPDGNYSSAGAASYLDYRPLAENERPLIEAELDAEWLRRDWDNEVMAYAVTDVIPEHVNEIKAQRIEQTDRVEQQVKARLTKEINHWDHRAQVLKDKERAGKDTRLRRPGPRRQARGPSPGTAGRAAKGTPDYIGGTPG